jgi:hemerythrin
MAHCPGNTGHIPHAAFYMRWYCEIALFFSLIHGILPVKEICVDNLMIAWDDKFLMNCETIDNQHKDLVDMINELIRGCNRGAAAADVAFLKTIRKAVEYAQTHFVTEEKYMQQVNYPDFAAHKKEHEAFIAEMVKQLKAFEESQSDPGMLIGFLKNWLLNHIAVTDKKYVPYLAGL